ncbi:MAG: hypothetical protein RR465_02580, partial [Mucinivorans sp.]
MRIKLNRRGILFISFAILVLTIIILGIVWSVRSCSSSRKATPTTDSLAAFDTIGISYDESMSEDSLFTEDSTRAASKESSTQNYLERLVFSDMHKSLYGLDSQDYEVEAGEIQSGQTFSHLMNDKYNVNIAVINELIEKSKGIFDMRDLRAGKPYTALLSQDTTAHGALEYLVYEKSASEFIIFSTGDSVFVRKDKKEVTSEEK